MTIAKLTKIKIAAQKPKLLMGITSVNTSEKQAAVVTTVVVKIFRVVCLYVKAIRRFNESFKQGQFLLHYHASHRMMIFSNEMPRTKKRQRRLRDWQTGMPAICLQISCATGKEAATSIRQYIARNTLSSVYDIQNKTIKRLPIAYLTSETSC